MRHASSDLAAIQRATETRHAAMRETILASLYESHYYPWALLMRLQPQKFYSDLFEAVLGAVWVDSGGDWTACSDVAERVGILPLMRRLLRDQVHLLHPKEELGRLAVSERVEYYVYSRRVGSDAREEEEEEEVVVYVGSGGGGGGGDVSDSDGEDGLLGEEREYVCRIKVGEREVAEVVGGGASKEEARVKAAEEACRVLRKKGGG